MFIALRCPEERCHGVDGCEFHQTLLEVVPEIDANPMSFYRRAGRVKGSVRFL